MSKLSDTERAALLRRLDRFVVWCMVLGLGTVVATLGVVVQVHSNQVRERQAEVRSSLKSLLNTKALQSEVRAGFGDPRVLSPSEDLFKVRISQGDVWSVHMIYRGSPPRVESIVVDGGAVELSP